MTAARLFALLCALSAAAAFAQEAEEPWPAPPLLDADVPLPLASSPDEWATPQDAQQVAQQPIDQAAPVTPGAPPPPSPQLQATAAQPPAAASARVNRVTVGPLPAIGGALVLEYERALNDRISLFAGPRIGLFNRRGIGGSLGMRAYVGAGAKAPSGWWLGPELYVDHYARVQDSTTSVSREESFALFGLAMGGYTAVSENGFTWSLGAGLGGGYLSTSAYGPVTESLFGVNPGTAQGLAPAFGAQFNIGYAF